jgi:hypothetical protein
MEGRTLRRGALEDGVQPVEEVQEDAVVEVRLLQVDQAARLGEDRETRVATPESAEDGPLRGPPLRGFRRLPGTGVKNA